PTQLLEKVLAKQLREHVARLCPGAKVTSIEPLGPDTGATSGVATKTAGYGLPVRMTIEDGDGRREVVWRVASANEFGHDRRADRAAAMVQAVEDFEQTPQHVRVSGYWGDRRGRR